MSFGCSVFFAGSFPAMNAIQAVDGLSDTPTPNSVVLVDLAELQEREVGDGMTSVVIVAAELLKRANDLVRNKIHPTSIISGYILALREACKYVEEKLAVKVVAAVQAVKMTNAQGGSQVPNQGS